MKGAGLFGPGMVSPLEPVPEGPAAPGKPGVTIPGVGPAGEALVRGRPVSGKLLSGASPAQKQQFEQFAGGIKPAYALKILATMLQSYTENCLEEAESLAKANQETASKIVNLNDAWFESKASLQKYCNPAKPQDQDGDIWHADKAPPSSDPDIAENSFYYPDSAINKLKTALGAVCDDADVSTPEKFVDYLFPGADKNSGWPSDRISYSDVQTAGAIIAQNCAKVQVTIDTANNEFKNIMMMMNAAKEEYKALNKEIIALTKM